MTNWNFRSDGAWSQGTLKRRETGQWVTIGGGGGGGGGDLDFDWENPPNRSTTVNHSAVGGTIQDALNNLSSDEELVLDDGPYAESFTIPRTNEITVTGGDGAPAVINIPSSPTRIIDTSITDDGDSGFLGTTVNASAVRDGDKTVSVDDTSPFSEGQIVRLHDPDDPYRGLTSSNVGVGGGPPTSEYNVIDSVGSSSVTFERGVLDDYNDANGNLELQTFNWSSQDLHIDNLDLQGDGASDKSSIFGIDLRYTKDAWLTNITGSNWYRDLVYVAYCYHTSLLDSDVNTTGTYGFRPESTHHIRAKNIHISNTGRHSVAHGVSSDMKPGYDAEWHNVSLSNNDNEDLWDVHFGFRDASLFSASNDGGSTMKLFRPRARNVTVDGVTFDCNGTHGIYSSQAPLNCEFTNLDLTGLLRVCRFRPYNDRVNKNTTFEDCQFTQSDTAYQLFDFDTTGGSISECNVENLQITNCALNGEWIDDGTVENSRNFDGSGVSVTYTTTYPSDQTPSEYFG